MTKKLYLEDYLLLEFETTVVEMSENCLILEETLFHPQGGGQPTDFGKIESKEGDIVFIVSMVKADRQTGIVSHNGEYSKGGEKGFSKGDKVIMKVDEEKRILHTFCHSGGHLMDVAVRNIGYKEWEPSRAYHFPKGSYVEFEMKGVLIKEEREKFLENLQKEIEKLSAENEEEEEEEVIIRMVPYDELPQYFENGKVPSYLPKTEIRMVTYGSVTHPCEGTHIKKFSELKGHLFVRKLKKRKKNMRISYDIKM